MQLRAVTCFQIKRPVKTAKRSLNSTVFSNRVEKKGGNACHVNRIFCLLDQSREPLGPGERPCTWLVRVMNRLKYPVRRWSKRANSRWFLLKPEVACPFRRSVIRPHSKYLVFLWNSVFFSSLTLLGLGFPRGRTPVHLRGPQVSFLLCK